jgi:anti-sigma factor (TIGR02949 family)
MSWINDLRKLLSRVRGASPAAEGHDPITCREAVDHLLEWLDGELEETESKRVGAHLETCGRCYPRLRFERAFREALARASRSQEAPAELREGVEQALRRDGFGPD